MTDNATRNVHIVAVSHHLTVSLEKSHAGSTMAQASGTGVNVGAIETDGELHKRLPLVFAINRHKGRFPRHLTLDRALDWYGATQFPDEWGLLHNWEHMPFRWSDQTGSLTQYSIAQKGRSKGKRVSTLLHVSDSSRADAAECYKIFKYVWLIFRSAMRKRELYLYGLHPQTGRRLIAQHRGLFTIKHIDVFFTGTALLEDNQGKAHRCRLFVQKREFKEWIAHQYLNALISELKTIIEEQASEKRYRITVDIWKDTLLPCFGIYGQGHLSKILEERLFRQLSVKHGRGAFPHELRACFDDNKDQLLAAIKPVIERFTGRPAATQVDKPARDPVGEGAKQRQALA